MSDERRVREPGQVVAALEIAQRVRNALADGIDESRETGWDTGVLFYELVRTLGVLVRFSEAPPSRLEELIEFLRRVYAGLASGSTPSVEEVLQRMFPESNSQVLPSDTQPDSNVLQ